MKTRRASFAVALATLGIGVLLWNPVRGLVWRQEIGWELVKRQKMGPLVDCSLGNMTVTRSFASARSMVPTGRYSMAINGSPILSGQYRNGGRDDLWRFWYPRGGLAKEKQYVAPDAFATRRERPLSLDDCITRDFSDCRSYAPGGALVAKVKDGVGAEVTYPPTGWGRYGLKLQTYGFATNCLVYYSKAPTDGRPYTGSGDREYRLSAFYVIGADGTPLAICRFYPDGIHLSRLMETTSHGMLDVCFLKNGEIVHKGTTEKGFLINGGSMDFPVCAYGELIPGYTLSVQYGRAVIQSPSKTNTASPPIPSK